MDDDTYKRDLAICRRIYANSRDALRAAYEIQYYREHGKLPELSVFIDYIENIDGKLLIVHKDKDEYVQ